MNKRWIVITSIYLPTDVVLKKLQFGYSVVVVGDKKTPHDAWMKISIPNFYYLSPDEQESLFPEFSRILGFGTYARKNLGYLFAIMNGAESIWDTDDDTFIRQEALPMLSDFNLCEHYSVEGKGFFNPYQFFAKGSQMWPRGYPLRNIAKDKLMLNDQLQIKKVKQLSNFDILQTLVNLEPDLDAIYRMTVGDSIMDFPIDNKIINIGEGVVSPGNTQSTLWLNKDKFKYLYIPRWVTFRFCDILKMYIAQSKADFSYAGFWSDQIRNPHDYMIDFESEVDCYLKTEPLVELLKNTNANTLAEIYRVLEQNDICNSQEVHAAEVFEELVSGFSHV
jgi:hypothetical protein